MKFENYRSLLRNHDTIASQEFDYLDTLDLGAFYAKIQICQNI